MKTIDDIELIETCRGCPEQYDAIVDGEIIGYLRLRHGYFSVEYKGELVYEATPNGDGIFECEDRPYFLWKAKQALLKKITN